MAEAVITRGGIGGGSADISNETKQSLGLNNNASLDDVISTLSLKDPNFATITVTALDVDGSPIVGTNITMSPKGGTSLTYQTNGEGKCLFKTNIGQCDFTEQNPGYVDIIPGNVRGAATVQGSVMQIKLQRQKLNSNSTISYFSNTSIKFSNFLNTVDVLCEGAGGGGGGGFLYSIYGSVPGSGGSGSVSEFTGSSGGSGGKGYKNIKSVSVEPNRSYVIRIGSGGSGGYGTSIAGSRTSYAKRDSAGFADTTTSKKAGDGSSGGTSTFDSILSSSGGGGGGGGYLSGNSDDGYNCIGGSSGTSGNGTRSGGSGGYYVETSSASGTVNTSKTGWEYNWVDVRYSASARAGGAGSGGLIQLSNFKYKI